MIFDEFLEMLLRITKAKADPKGKFEAQIVEFIGEVERRRGVTMQGVRSS
jgi:hypothetical protein